MLYAQLQSRFFEMLRKEVSQLLIKSERLLLDCLAASLLIFSDEGEKPEI